MNLFVVTVTVVFTAAAFKVVSFVAIRLNYSNNLHTLIKKKIKIVKPS